MTLTRTFMLEYIQLVQRYVGVQNQQLFMKCIPDKSLDVLLGHRIAQEMTVVDIRA